MADGLLYSLVGLKENLAGKSVDHTLRHTRSKNLVLSASLYLFVGFLAAQMALAGLTMGNFSGSGDLKSFGNSFVRLSHSEIWEKVDL
jgi:hypothetical protein